MEQIILLYQKVRFKVLQFDLKINSPVLRYYHLLFIIYLDSLKKIMQIHNSTYKTLFMHFSILNYLFNIPTHDN